MSIFRVKNDSENLDFPSIRPTLNLDFANTKTLDRRIRFVRSSGGTYVDFDKKIKYSAINQPRFDHDPITGESLGLLIEESRTNILLQSQNFNAIDWVKSNVDIKNSDINSPDITSKPAELISTSDTPFSGRIQQGIFVEDGEYTISFFAKRAVTNWLMITIEMGGRGGRRAWFDLDTGLIGGNSPTFGGNWEFNYDMKPYGNGWYRCYVTVKINTGSVSLTFFPMAPNGNNTANTSIGNSVFIWGAQLENGPFPTSYIPTINSARTRSFDIVQIIGNNFDNFFNKPEGTIYTEALGVNNISNSFTRRYWELGSSNGFRLASGYLENSTRFLVLNNAKFSTNLRKSNLTPRISPIKNVVSFKDNYFRLCSNGQLSDIDVGPDIFGKVPDVNLLTIGSSHNFVSDINAGDTNLNGTIKKFVYWPRVLSDTQLRSITK